MPRPYGSSIECLLNHKCPRTGWIDRVLCIVSRNNGDRVGAGSRVIPRSEVELPFSIAGKDELIPFGECTSRKRIRCNIDGFTTSRFVDDLENRTGNNVDIRNWTPESESSAISGNARVPGASGGNSLPPLFFPTFTRPLFIGGSKPSQESSGAARDNWTSSMKPPSPSLIPIAMNLNVEEVPVAVTK